MAQLHPLVLYVWTFLQLTIYKEGSETTIFYATHLSRKADDCTLGRTFPVLLLICGICQTIRVSIRLKVKEGEFTLGEFWDKWFGQATTGI